MQIVLRQADKEDRALIAKIQHDTEFAVRDVGLQIVEIVEWIVAQPDPVRAAFASLEIFNDVVARLAGDDEHIVAIDKPSGILSVPGIGPEKADCARSRVQAMYLFASGPMTVHRLDIATSGVLVLALDAATHRNFSVQFERRRVSKRYVALVEGHLERGEGQCRTPMRKDLDRSPTQLVDFEQGKESCTEWRVLAHGQG